MADVAKKSVGRPSKYTNALAETICARMMDGESLRSVCRDEDMPSRMTVLRWVASNEAFRDQYVRACEVRADLIFDEMFEIADDTSNDHLDIGDVDGVQLKGAFNSEHVQRSRLRIDTRKWALSKMNPKKYGDKLQHTGSDGEGPVEFKWLDK